MILEEGVDSIMGLSGHERFGPKSNFSESVK